MTLAYLPQDLMRILQSVRQFQRQADFLLETAMSPDARLCLTKSVKGAMIHANTNILLRKNIETTKAAESAQATWKTRAWRSLQHGGIMYACDGREMSQTKAEADLEKARTQVCREEEKEARKKREEEAAEERRVAEGKKKEEDTIRQLQEEKEQATALAIKLEKQKARQEKKEKDEREKTERRGKRKRDSEEKRLQGIIQRQEKTEQRKKAKHN